MLLLDDDDGGGDEDDDDGDDHDDGADHDDGDDHDDHDDHITGSVCWSMRETDSDSSGRQLERLQLSIHIILSVLFLSIPIILSFLISCFIFSSYILLPLLIIDESYHT